MQKKTYITKPTPDEKLECCLVCGNDILECACEPCPNCDNTEHCGVTKCLHCHKEGCENCMTNNMHFACEAAATGGGYIGEPGKLADPEAPRKGMEALFATAAAEMKRWLENEDQFPDGACIDSMWRIVSYVERQDWENPLAGEMAELEEVGGRLVAEIRDNLKALKEHMRQVTSERDALKALLHRIDQAAYEVPEAGSIRSILREWGG